ncbi:MAG TPA: PhnD/SsuA/transferrin family substrate-binding protein [Coleofasciculaceae cyanobacterium]|jgi:phosphonate transport system substrate-binding protein
MYLKCILLIIVFTLTACNRSPETIISKHNIGVVSYGKNENPLKQYTDFQNYLGTRLNSVIEIEPTFNEVRALQQISSNKWDLVFAPPGLAAIAISRYNYLPLVPLEGSDKTRSVLVVQKDSAFEQRQDLANQTIALGQKGSATDYYLPIYNLYGLKFKEVLYAPTPQNILQLLNDGKVEVGALSLADYNLYRRDFDADRFKVIYLDRHNVPPGAILISDRLERNQQEQIRLALVETPSFIASSAGYLPNEELPDYSYMIKVIERVKTVIKESPMVFK